MDSESSDLQSKPTNEPSLGPACLVVAILLLAVVCIVCAFGSWFMFGDQSVMAKKGITQQLIPWVAQSNLPADEKQSIVNQLHEVVSLVQSEQLTSRQLSRLKNCLEDNPILLWGNVLEILGQAKAAGLSEVETEAAKRTAQRLLRMTNDRQLSRNDLEFVLERCVQQRADALGLAVRSPLTGEQIREFATRGQQLADGKNVSLEPFDKSPSEVFASMLKDALKVE